MKSGSSRRRRRISPGYGRIERDFPSAKIEIVRWPAQGWRPVDDDTGDQGGTTEGTFAFTWKGEVLYGRNDAVGDSYLIGWSRDPSEASETTPSPDRSGCWCGTPTTIPMAGSCSSRASAFPTSCRWRCPATTSRRRNLPASTATAVSASISIPASGTRRRCRWPRAAEFDDRQGRVHARASCNFVEEFGAYLTVPLRAP